MVAIQHLAKPVLAVLQQGFSLQAVFERRHYLRPDIKQVIRRCVLSLDFEQPRRHQNRKISSFFKGYGIGFTFGHRFPPSPRWARTGRPRYARCFDGGGG
jgi:hypothetical protein